MRWRLSARSGVLAAVLLLAGAAFAQRMRLPFEDENEVLLPPDAEDPAEYSFARLIYQNAGGDEWWGRRRRGSWQVDAPAADRHFLQGVRRLTGIHARAKERNVSLLDDELFDYPWLYGVEVGRWSLSEDEAARLREYLLRGGFLMVDDFHGQSQWHGFVEGMTAVFPDRPIVDIPESDPIFHVFYNVDTRTQVPGIQYVRSGRTYEGYDGAPPRWRGVYDDHGRVMVVINFNMDLGDAWEWADYPDYPEKWTALAYRYGINYVVYAMTH